MKATTVTVFVAILATALILANFSSAEAKKADTSDRLSPKSFGPHTYTKVNIEKTYDSKYKSTKPSAYNPTDHKTQQKLIEAQKALEFAKKKYGL